MHWIYYAAVSALVIGVWVMVVRYVAKDISLKELDMEDEWERFVAANEPNKVR